MQGMVTLFQLHPVVLSNLNFAKYIQPIISPSPKPSPYQWEIQDVKIEETQARISNEDCCDQLLLGKKVSVKLHFT